MYNYVFKYLLVGDSGVGKSAISNRFTKGNFIENNDSTIGVEFGVKVIRCSDVHVKVQLWDTAGQETFRSITRSYYRNAACALVVYDIGNRQSFENIPTWIADVQKVSPLIRLVLVGNKKDTPDRQVHFVDAQKCATQYNMHCMEVSAMHDLNVSKLFQTTARAIIDDIHEGAVNFADPRNGIRICQQDEIDFLKAQDMMENEIDKKKCCRI